MTTLVSRRIKLLLHACVHVRQCVAQNSNVTRLVTTVAAAAAVAADVAPFRAVPTTTLHVLRARTLHIYFAVAVAVVAVRQQTQPHTHTDTSPHD